MHYSESDRRAIFFVTTGAMQTAEAFVFVVRRPRIGKNPSPMLTESALFAKLTSVLVLASMR